MNHPKHISISNYDYDLPDHRIAKYPLPNRDDSKLLVYQGGEIQVSKYRSIANFLEPGTMLVFNNTKVIQARLAFKKPTGARIEIFCLEPYELAIEDALSRNRSVRYTCLVGNAKKWKGESLQAAIQSEYELSADLVHRQDGKFVVEFNWSGGLTFGQLLEKMGVLPLPPYLNRATEVSDLERYQTLLAKINGSVAAPTAGLHFTNQIFKSLQENGITKEEVTLHVGAGTFMPVKSETIGSHKMHEEFFTVSKGLIEKLASNNSPIIPVGTTSLRTIESLYWIGTAPEKYFDTAAQMFTLPQWTPYESKGEGGLIRLLKFMGLHDLTEIKANTGLMIAPGYKYHIAKGLITNFHQPKSTLLLLVSALVGDNWKDIYNYALENDFRFLSYGDGCLLLPDIR